MPVLVRIRGAKVCMFYNDHLPPHVHVRDGQRNALVSIETGEVFRGDVDPGPRDEVLEWITTHREQLASAWEHACVGRSLSEVWVEGARP